MIGAATARARLAYSAGVPHLMIASVAISGISYLQQLVIAKFVTPAEFATVRATESAVVALLLLASCGMPTLAVRLIAEVQEHERGAMLRRLLGIALTASLLVAIVATGWSLLAPSPTTKALPILIWVVLITSSTRVVYNYHQGVLKVRPASMVATGAATVAFGVLTLLVWQFGLRGWIAGRFIGESFLLAGMLWMVRSVLRTKGQLDAKYDNAFLVRFGLTVMVALFLRGALDSSAILLLGFVQTPAEDIGFFGLGTLAVTAMGLLPASLTAVVLPRMVTQLARDSGRPYLYRGTAWALGVTLALAVGVSLLLPVALRLFLPAYMGAVPIVRALVWVAPCRAVNGIAGSQLLALSRVRDTIIAYAGGLVALTATTLWAGNAFGAIGAAWGTVAVELTLAASLFVLAAVRGPAPPAGGQPSAALEAA
jgi:O-antigen/teichoic acid export membrane protein